MIDNGTSTKPLHPTQKILKEFPDWAVKIYLQEDENYELERLLLGFGPGIRVLEPLSLRIRNLLSWALQAYQPDHNPETKE